MAQHELGSLAFDERRNDATAELVEQALRGFDEIVRDYPDNVAVRRHRGRTANLLASAYNNLGRARAARPLLEQAIADQRLVLQRQPLDRTASRHLAQHYRTTLVTLRMLADWDALAATARAVGALGGEENTGRAGRELLRCAAHTTGAAREALGDEALAMLTAAVKGGMRIDADDPLYREVLDDPRFEALLKGR